MLTRVWQCSTDKAGCREVQRALDEADPEICTVIAAELRGHVWEAVEHIHANYVLQKCVEILSSCGSQWIIEELVGCGKGSGVYLAKHRLGCRIFQRLLEHCTADQVKPLVDDLLSGDLEKLCAHPFANYVFQHLLEHGAEGQRRRLLAVLIDNVEWMGTDHHAAAVVSQALHHGSPDEKAALGKALLDRPALLLQMATRRLGHETVQRLFQLQLPGQQKASDLLIANFAMLRSSKYGRDVQRCLQTHRMYATPIAAAGA